VNVRTATAAVLVGTMLVPAARAAEPADEAVLRRDAALVESFRRSREALEWTDEAIRNEWRLQRRPGTESCRVLDPTDGVVRAGTAAECRAALAAIEAEGRLPPPRGETVILLHGLGEGRDSMQPLAEQLRRSLDATVLTFGYASVRADIDAHGRALAAVVAGLPTTRRISFVGHSLGNLVVRRWLAIAPAADRGRVHRLVMLGPPNQGSDLARRASRIWGVAESAEGAARDLVVEWQRVAPGLAVPDCPFGIIAGGKGDDAGFSSLLDGDDDAVVRVAETHLPGADDFLLLPVHHAAMMRDAAVQRATREFLAHGRFPDPPAPAAAARE
jgi:pimeloyl-ACP methyl ester carboxylesterase